MTTEDDFQAALDANPKDHHTRLVFADWLQERDDPRAEGYRALGIHSRYPDEISVGRGKAVWWWSECDKSSPLTTERNWRLPRDWCKRIKVRGARSPYYPVANSEHANTRREAENAAALAFFKLTPKRRIELLTPPPPKKPRANTPPVKKPPAKGTTRAKAAKTTKGRPKKKRGSE